MRYGAAVNHFLIKFSFTFFLSIEAANMVCKRGEVALGSVSSCFSPQNPDSCGRFGNPSKAAILSHECGIIYISASNDLCADGWPSLLGRVQCDEDVMPITVYTKGAGFANCRQATDDDNHDCGIPVLTRPFEVKISYCCAPVRIPASDGD